MIKKFLQSASIYFIANAISKIINFLFFAYIVRVLTLEEMGIFSLSNLLLTVLTTIMSFSIDAGFNRYFFECTSEKEQREFELATINFLFLINVCCIVGLLSVQSLIYKMFPTMNNNVFCIIICTPFVTTIANIFFIKLRLQDKVKNVALLMIMQSIINVVASYILLNTFQNKIMALFLGILIQYLVITIVYFYTVKIKVGLFNWRLIKKSIRFSCYLLPSNLGTYTSLFSGKYIISKFLDIIYVGIFEGCNRVANIIGTMMEPLYLATTPMIFKRYNDKSFNIEYYKILNINFTVLFLLVLLFSLFNREIISIVLGEKYLAYMNILHAFTLIAMFMFVSKVIAINIHLSQKSQYDTFIEIVSGLINVVLTVYGVISYGFVGVIFAGVTTYFIRMVLYIIFANKLFPKFHINIIYMTLFIFVTCAMICIHYLLSNVTIFIKMIVIIIEFIIILLFFRKKLLGVN